MAQHPCRACDQTWLRPQPQLSMALPHTLSHAHSLPTLVHSARMIASLPKYDALLNCTHTHSYTCTHADRMRQHQASSTGLDSLDDSAQHRCFDNCTSTCRNVKCMLAQTDASPGPALITSTGVPSHATPKGVFAKVGLVRVSVLHDFP
jgi:hypothetical protein